VSEWRVWTAGNARWTLQAVSDSPTMAFFAGSFVICCFVFCVFRCCCVCVLHCCVAIVGVGVAQCGLGCCCWCLRLCGICVVFVFLCAM